ncbi:hemolysin family protein [soil metagenome]
MADDVLKLIAVAVLILLNGLFVAAEFAVVAARRTQIDARADDAGRSFRAVHAILRDPGRFIVACQIGITFSTLVLGWLAQPAIAHLVEPLLDDLMSERAIWGTHALSALLALLVIGSLHVVIGGQLPKVISVQRPERAMLTAGPIARYLTVPLKPLVDGLYWLTDRLLMALGLTRQAEVSLVYTEDELKLLLTASRMQGYLEPGEQEMIERVFAFADVETDEVMVPRTEMLALASTASLDEVADLMSSTGHTRFPVYGNDLDDLIGVFHVKDLLQQTLRMPTTTFSLRRFVRPAVYVSVHTPLDELLTTMKAKRSHMAVVVDEYGGTAGLVTLEDVLERIVGAVTDRVEAGPADAEQLENGSYRLSGLLSIGDVNERFGTAISDDYYNSIGGFVFGQLGRKPELGDEVRANGHLFRVVELDGLRIDRIEIASSHDVSVTFEEEQEELQIDQVTM